MAISQGDDCCISDIRLLGLSVYAFIMLSPKAVPNVVRE